MELTPEDTYKDLQRLLINAIPKFEFPRQNLSDYHLEPLVLNSEGLVEDNSSFGITLTREEINILAILMKLGWIERQIASVEYTRMKYSGADFKFTSQANHLGKLLALGTEVRRDSTHMQRLYKRRKRNSETGEYETSWSLFNNYNK